VTAQISLFTGRRPLGKAFSLNHDGDLGKTPLANSIATVRTVDVATAAALATLLKDCTAYQALALGTCSVGHGKVVTSVNLVPVRDATARTKDNFRFSDAPGWALLDVDAKEPSVIEKITRLGGVWPVLSAVYPPLAQAARARRASQSACVGVVGDDPPATLSEHIYILLRRGSDAVALVERLHQRLWLAGIGWVNVSKAGQLLERSLIDRAVASPERLIFEGPPVIDDDLCLYIDKRRRAVTARDGIAIAPPPPLTEEAENRYEGLVKAAQDGLKQYAEHVAYEYQRIRGADEATARAMAQGIGNNAVMLSLGQRLYFKRAGTLTVREALLDADRYIGQDCLDPVEPIRRDYCARFLRGKQDYTCFVKSFAHGGQIYQLQYDIETAKRAILACPTELQPITYYSLKRKVLAGGQSGVAR
jgi:hypothetical protein